MVVIFSGKTGALTFGYLSDSDVRSRYVDTANVSYNPYIIDTRTAFWKTCRLLRNRFVTVFINFVNFVCFL